MDDPAAGLIGEDLCRTKAPRDCACATSTTGRTTAKNFLGVAFGTDNGGVHLNSTIFSGALWDMRQDLGGELADRIVYKALTEYMTPLDGFTEGRDAVLAAAKDLGVDRRAAQRGEAVLQRPRHRARLGGRPRRRLRPAARQAQHQRHRGPGRRRLVDRRRSPTTTAPSRTPCTPAARTARGAEADQPQRRPLPRLPGDRRQDGRVAGVRQTGVDILSRPLAGGPVKVLWHGRSVGNALDVDGDVVVFAYNNHGGRAGVAYLSLKDPANKVQIGGGTYHRATFPSVSDGKVVYQDRQRVRAVYESTTRVIDVATGAEHVVQQAAAAPAWARRPSTASTSTGCSTRSARTA